MPNPVSLRRVAAACVAALALVAAAPAAADQQAALPDLGTHGNYDAGRIGDAIRNYHSSGRWARDQRVVGRRARRSLRRELAQHRRGRGERGSPAIVLDVDDTSLSYYRSFEQLDFVLDRGPVAVAILRADAPAIKPTLALYRLAQRRGVRVFFVTGRPEGIRDATVLNLERAGYRGRHRLFMRPNDDHRASVVPYKVGVRRRLERHGFEILVNVGDQYSDLEGGYAERRFKVPNPMYFLR